MSKTTSVSQPSVSNVNITVPDDDVLNPKIGVSCLDFLLIELVPLAQRITERLHAREQALRDEFQRSKIPHRQRSTTGAQQPSHAGTDSNSVAESTGASKEPPSIISTSTSRGDTTSTATITSSTIPGTNIPSDLGQPPLMDDEMREAVFWRLDKLGYRVGQGLVERFSANKPRPTTPLDAIKFVCKDLWTLLWRKQIDNLKTNHRGVFVLTDARFQALSRMSVDQRAGARAGEEALRRAQSYLYFPCGIIRGALASLGMEVSVTAETTEIPIATFQIKSKGAKP